MGLQAEADEMLDNLFQRGKSVAINNVCKNMSFRRSLLRQWDTLEIATQLRFTVFQLSL